MKLTAVRWRGAGRDLKTGARGVGAAQRFRAPSCLPRVKHCRYRVFHSTTSCLIHPCDSILAARVHNSLMHCAGRASNVRSNQQSGPPQLRLDWMAGSRSSAAALLPGRRQQPRGLVQMQSPKLPSRSSAAALVPGRRRVAVCQQRGRGVQQRVPRLPQLNAQLRAHLRFVLSGMFNKFKCVRGGGMGAKQWATALLAAPCSFTRTHTQQQHKHSQLHTQTHTLLASIVSLVAAAAPSSMPSAAPGSAPFSVSVTNLR